MATAKACTGGLVWLCARFCACLLQLATTRTTTGGGSRRGEGVMRGGSSDGARMGGRRVIQLPAKMKSSPMPVPPSGGPFDTGEEGGAGGEHVRRLAVRADSSEGFFDETGVESRAGGEWGWGKASIVHCYRACWSGVRENFAKSFHP